MLWTLPLRMQHLLASFGSIIKVADDLYVDWRRDILPVPERLVSGHSDQDARSRDHPRRSSGQAHNRSRQWQVWWDDT